MAETFAAQYLSRTLGWSVTCRNWRCRAGELDIVALDGAQLVVVEVRSRSSQTHGTAAESVATGKLRQVRRLVPLLLAQIRPQQPDTSVRVDVIAIELRGDQVAGLEHFRNALDAWA
ncbi:YraN family protein [Alicyclobacillus cycloheptanicus]|uniref:Endonuclease n=1 Tax=Alicyclobacillus cycloheptanicus TaxID=1457 RepID=A0ABT9XJW3_9BACL|nr:YraN family protein [Alicyclobacillus cycloheptanicus]MDQ0190575.1 putative endonuclease [Alicyclobacillus cycloheptanicus]WDM01415.1 YraN family protein [Alicyclobacillus cycloheptanicus]